MIIQISHAIISRSTKWDRMQKLIDLFIRGPESARCLRIWQNAESLLFKRLLYIDEEINEVEKSRIIKMTETIMVIQNAPVPPGIRDQCSVKARAEKMKPAAADAMVSIVTEAALLAISQP